MIESFGQFVKRTAKKTAVGSWNLTKRGIRTFAVSAFGNLGNELTRPLAKQTVIKKPTARRPRRKRP